MSRTFSPYEQTQLAKHNISLENARAFGEMPVEYITGHVEFCGLDLLVDKNVLIPRIETEGLVELAVQECKKFAAESDSKNALAEKTLGNNSGDANKKLRIIDFGTGSGAIITALGRKLQELGIAAELYASDISQGALEVAQKNAEMNHVPISFFQSNLLDQVPNVQFDLIIANLPYIPTKQIEALDESVREFEPIAALDGGSDGFELYSKLLNQIRTRGLSSEILLEIDSSQGEIIEQLDSRIWRAKIFKDTTDKIGFVLIKSSHLHL